MTNRKQILQRQMEETRANLSAKLDSLGIQVKSETAAAVTGVVRNAASSLTSVFDIRRQISRHPWLALGGSAAMGYLLLGRILGRKRSVQAEQPSIAEPPSSSNPVVDDRRTVPVETVVDRPPHANEPSAWADSRRQLSELAVHSLANIVTALAERAIPVFVERIMEHAKAAEGDQPPFVFGQDVLSKNHHHPVDVRASQNGPAAESRPPGEHCSSPPDEDDSQISLELN